MKVWIVFYSWRNIKTICGVFSEDWKAERYIQGVPEEDRKRFFSQPYEVDAWR